MSLRMEQQQDGLWCLIDGSAVISRNKTYEEAHKYMMKDLGVDEELNREANHYADHLLDDKD